MPVLSNSVGTQKQKQGVANTGSRPVAPQQQQQQAGGRKCRLVTREDSEQWFLECTRIKKRWGPGYKVPRQLVSIMLFDSTDERAYVVVQFDSKELVTLHSVAELRDYVQQQQRTAGGKQRQQPPQLKQQQRPHLQQRRPQQQHQPTEKEKRMRQALGINNKAIAKNRLAPVVVAMPAAAPSTQSDLLRQQAKPRTQVFKPSDAGWRDRLVEITQQWPAFAKHVARLEEVKVSVRPNGGIYKAYKVDGQTFRSIKELEKHFADVNNALAVAITKQPTSAFDVDGNNDNNNSDGAAVVLIKQSRPKVVRLAEDEDGNTRRHKLAKVVVAVPNLDGEGVGSRDGVARAADIPVRMPAHLQRVLGVGAADERGVVIDGNGLGGAAQALVPFADDNSGGGLSAAEASFVYSGGSYPFFSNLARCSVHMATVSNVVVAAADVARPVATDAVAGASVAVVAVNAEEEASAEPVACGAARNDGFVDVADTMDADALALATMHGVMCLHRTISKLQQERDAACGIAERLLDHFMSASQLCTKAASV